MTRIAHLTTAHPRYDVRVFRKECRSLAAHGHEVQLFVADGKGDEVVDGVHIRDIGAPAGRLRRILFQPWKMLRAVLRADVEVCHFHDPELLPVALILHWRGRSVIYDTHEDLPRQILSKFWIKPWLRRAIAVAAETVEAFTSRRLAAVVAATPHIAARFAQINPRTVDINNYPLSGELDTGAASMTTERVICYTGSITRIRCAIEMMRALERLDVRLILAGPFESAALEAEMRAMPAWDKVDYRGTYNRKQLRDILAQSRAGLVLFYPEPNHLDAQPNKMFEYMAGGVPVIASSFPLWRDLMARTGAGVCADPLDPADIARAIDGVLADADAAGRMGQAGRAAVAGVYRWEHEEAKLLQLYRSLA